MNTVGQILQRDAPRLADALTLTAAEARIEAQLLLGRALEVSRAWLIAHADDPLPAPAVARYRGWLERRLAGEPVAYILGEKEFFGRVFTVSPAVLIPRPETELLVELAQARCASYAAPRVLDLGTGSGCIAITLALECPRAEVTAVDVSPAALAVARENAARHGASVGFFEGHWFDALGARQFDLVVANPPYVAPGDPHLERGDVRHEPPSALVAKEAGMADIRHIVRQAAARLAPGGALLLEHGYDQATAVRQMLAAAGFAEVASWRDLAGIERVSVGVMSE